MKKEEMDDLIGEMRDLDADERVKLMQFVCVILTWVTKIDFDIQSEDDKYILVARVDGAGSGLKAESELYPPYHIKDVLDTAMGLFYYTLQEKVAVRGKEMMRQLMERSGEQHNFKKEK